MHQELRLDCFFARPAVRGDYTMPRRLRGLARLPVFLADRPAGFLEVTCHLDQKGEEKEFVLAISVDLRQPVS